MRAREAAKQLEAIIKEAYRSWAKCSVPDDGPVISVPAAVVEALLRAAKRPTKDEDEAAEIMIRIHGDADCRPGTCDAESCPAEACSRATLWHRKYLRRKNRG